MVFDLAKARAAPWRQRGAASGRESRSSSETARPGSTGSRDRQGCVGTARTAWRGAVQAGGLCKPCQAGAHRPGEGRFAAAARAGSGRAATGAPLAHADRWIQAQISRASISSTVSRRVMSQALPSSTITAAGRGVALYVDDIDCA